MITEYKNYIDNNFKYYEKLILDKNIIEPYFKVNIGNITLKRFISDKLGGNWHILTKKCLYCSNNYKYSIFKSHSNYCRNRACINLGVNNYKIHSDIKNELEINNLYQTFRKNGMNNKRALNEVKKYICGPSYLKCINKTYNNNIIYHTCDITNTIIPITIKNNILIKHLDKNNINIIEYYKKHFPEHIKFCAQCNKFTWMSYDLRKTIHTYRKGKFCNQEHYLKYKKLHKNEYKQSIESKKKQSDTIKLKILNNEWTPNITNSYANSRIKLQLNGINYKFRSTWEALFWLLNKDLKYEFHRIPYTYGGISKVYITDFTDTLNYIIYEIKPISFITDQNRAKFKFAEQWCNKNEYVYKIINEKYFFKNIELIIS